MDVHYSPVQGFGDATGYAAVHSPRTVVSRVRRRSFPLGSSRRSSTASDVSGLMFTPYSLAWQTLRGDIFTVFLSLTGFFYTGQYVWACQQKP